MTVVLGNTTCVVCGEKSGGEPINFISNSQPEIGWAHYRCADAWNAMKGWGGRMCCYRCRKDRGIKRKATIRVFSHSTKGGWGGDGFPACAEHESWAITEAMQPLATEPDWQVTAYYIDENEHGGPKMERRMFEAKSKKRGAICPR